MVFSQVAMRGDANRFIRTVPRGPAHTAHLAHVHVHARLISWPAASPSGEAQFHPGETHFLKHNPGNVSDPSSASASEVIYLTKWLGAFKGVEHALDNFFHENVVLLRAAISENF